MAKKLQDALDMGEVKQVFAGDFQHLKNLILDFTTYHIIWKNDRNVGIGQSGMILYNFQFIFIFEVALSFEVIFIFERLS